MARRLLREVGNAESGIDEAMRNLEVELRKYLQGARQLYVAFQDQIRRQADLVLDGCLSPDELASQIQARVAG